jgi:hypothetical protein
MVSWGCPTETGHQVIARHRRIAARRAAAAGDVVEVRRIADVTFCRIDGRVDEADGRFAVRHQLLVGQRNVAAHIGVAKLVPPYSLAVQVVWSAQT